MKWVSRRDKEQRGREEERGGGEERRSSYTAEVEARATGRERESRVTDWLTGQVRCAGTVRDSRR